MAHVAKKAAFCKGYLKCQGGPKPEASSTKGLLSKGRLKQSLKWNEFTRKSKMASHGASQLS